MKQYTDSLLVLSNDSIEQLYPDLPYDEGFWRADDVLATAVKGIAEIITGHGTVNVDFADVNTVMRGSGRAFMGSGRAEGKNRALDAVELSVTSLLLNHRDIKGAKNILLNISYGDKAVMQREAGSIRNYLQESTGWTASLIWGTAHKPSLGNERELIIVATGFPGGVDDVVSVPVPVEALAAAGYGTGARELRHGRRRLQSESRVRTECGLWHREGLHARTRHRAPRATSSPNTRRSTTCWRSYARDTARISQARRERRLQKLPHDRPLARRPPHRQDQSNG